LAANETDLENIVAQKADIAYLERRHLALEKMKLRLLCFIATLVIQLTT